MTPPVLAHELRKAYGPTRAVDGVSFEIREGEVYALLGQNGAGKSTAVEILEGHRQRDAGEAMVLGMDPRSGGRELRDRIGIVLQSSGIEGELTVREAITAYGSAYRRQRPLDEVVELAGLDGKVDARVVTLSGGQQRRLDLALGIVGYPEVLFLDEPTTGFDPAARRRAWDVVSTLCSGGTTVLLTTHYIDEAEHLADRVGIINKGKMVTEGTPHELMSRAGATEISFAPPDAALLDALRAVEPSSVVGDRVVTVSTESPTATLHRLTSWALEHDVELAQLVVRRPTLEDVYLELALEQDDEPGAERAT